MKNHLFQFIVAIILFTSCNSPQNPSTEEPAIEDLPNIVLIVGDDQGYPYFGFMGANYVLTPNMDSLAASGTLFTNGYVPQNHCRPSLQSLMTGTLPIDYNKEVTNLKKEAMSKIRFDSEESQKAWEQEFNHHAMKHFKTLPRLLADKGYLSFQGGKWWEYNYQNGGFTHGMTTGWTEEDRKKGGKWFKQFMGGSGLQLARATMQPVYDFIDQNGDNPFFIWFAPELPHYPFDAPDNYYNLYKDSDMTESAKRYYANCTWFDDGVGALISYLKEKGAFENTLFIYVNDNGWEQNPDQEFRHDSLRWHNGGDKGKLSMYDQSFRSPIIFSWKGKIEAGATKTDLMHSVDIPATILDYLDINIPESYFGMSYKNVIEGKNSNLRKEIVGTIHKMRSEDDMMGRDVEGYWIREGNWFFNWNITDNTKALYQLDKDPFSNANVVSLFPDLEEKFTNRLIMWKKIKKESS